MSSLEVAYQKKKKNLLNPSRESRVILIIPFKVLQVNLEESFIVKRIKFYLQQVVHDIKA